MRFCRYLTLKFRPGPKRYICCSPQFTSIEYLVNCRVLINFLHIFLHGIELKFEIYRVALKEWNSRFLGLCSEQRLSFFTLLDRTSFPHYIIITKTIKFGWKLFIFWVISYGLSFSGFAINFFIGGWPPKNRSFSQFFRTLLWYFLHIFLHGIELKFEIYRVALKEWNSRFLGLCSEQQLFLSPCSI